MKLITVIAAIACVGGIGYYLKNRKSDPNTETESKPQPFDINDTNSEIIEGELAFQDIVSYFKLLHLTQGTHTPFVATPSSEAFRSAFSGNFTKEGYKTLIAGVFNEQKNAMEVLRVFFARSIDAKTQDILSKAEDGLVVLN